VKKDLGDFAISEAEFQARAMSDALPAGVDVDFALPPSGQLRSIVTSRPFEGDVFSKWWGRVGATAKTDIARELRVGLAEGETTDQIVRRVAGTKAGRYMDGVFGKLRRNVESTVRTAANHVSTQAREDTYKENDDVVKGVQIVATLDGRTTEICMSEDGKVYNVGEGPRPPFHYSCRTTTSPVLKSWKEIGISLKEAPKGTRASLDGQVAEKQTYGSWLKKQPRDIQDDALGPRRAALFRSGDVKIDRFVDARGRKLTLDELRAKEGLEDA
jgi:SPP1 gp7 family putative phage head morphogenesis protein